jgi:hypothetical protein
VDGVLDLLGDLAVALDGDGDDAAGAGGVRAGAKIDHVTPR